MKLLSERLKWAMKEKTARDGVEVIPADIARAGRVSDTSASFWLNDSNGISAPKARLVGAYLGVNAVWLENGSGRPMQDAHIAAEIQSNVEEAPAIVGALRKLQVVGRVQAGPDGLLHIDDFAPGHGDGYMLWWATCADAYALRIRGESMSPRYLPGEFVGVDPCSDVTPNDEVIVILKDDRRMIKRLLWQRDDQACFESVNKNFPNIVFDLEEIEQMHLVLGNIPKAAFRSE